MAVLTIKNVSYRYDGTKNFVLKHVNASFDKGKIYTIVGKSGSGKSTLLSLIAGLDTCESGDIFYNGENLKDIDRDEYRAKGIGVVFQSYNLITNTTAVKNIVLSMNISGSREADKKASAYNLLRKVGIDEETANRTILKLSGGEQQRVAIARALSHNPDIIIADEPTGNLDVKNSALVFDLLMRLAKENGQAITLVTHNPEIANRCDTIRAMRDGIFIS